MEPGSWKHRNQQQRSDVGGRQVAGSQYSCGRGGFQPPLQAVDMEVGTGRPSPLGAPLRSLGPAPVSGGWMLVTCAGWCVRSTFSANAGGTEKSRSLADPQVHRKRPLAEVSKMAGGETGAPCGEGLVSHQASERERLGLDGHPHSDSPGSEAASVDAQAGPVAVWCLIEAFLTLTNEDQAGLLEDRSVLGLCTQHQERSSGRRDDTWRTSSQELPSGGLDSGAPAPSPRRLCSQPEG